MPTTKKLTRTADAVAILKKRHVRTPAREQELELARLNAKIARQIYALRVSARLTQEQLGKLIGTTGSVISRLEDDDYHGHSLPMLLKITQALKQRIEVRIVPQRLSHVPARAVTGSFAGRLRSRSRRVTKVR